MRSFLIKRKYFRISTRNKYTEARDVIDIISTKENGSKCKIFLIGSIDIAEKSKAKPKITEKFK